MYCSDCEKECKAIEVDVGYGDLEFWGYVSRHVDMVIVSDCCHSDCYLYCEPDENGDMVLIQRAEKEDVYNPKMSDQDI
jgi:hypothetical protein